MLYEIDPTYVTQPADRLRRMFVASGGHWELHLFVYYPRTHKRKRITRAEFAAIDPVGFDLMTRGTCVRFLDESLSAHRIVTGHGAHPAMPLMTPLPPERLHELRSVVTLFKTMCSNIDPTVVEFVTTSVGSDDQMTVGDDSVEKKWHQTETHPYT